MALIRCSKCGHMISDKAKKCPKCGANISNDRPCSTHVEYKTYHRPKKSLSPLIWILPLIVLGVVAAFIYFCITQYNSTYSEIEHEIVELDNTIPTEREGEIIEKTTIQEKYKDSADTVATTRNYSEYSGYEDNDGYDEILSERKLTETDLEGKTKKELEIMRNSIYARHGYRFRRDDLLRYFSQFSWYTPSSGDMTLAYSYMSGIERYNVEFIKKHE